jgi:hypothetical protein
MSRSTKNIMFILAFSVIPMFAFQNCSGVRFANMADATNEKTGLIADINDDAVVGEVIDEGDGGGTTPVPPVVDNDDDNSTPDDPKKPDAPKDVVDNDDDDSDDDDNSTPPIVTVTPPAGDDGSDDDDNSTPPIVNVAPPAGDDGGGSQVAASCMDSELTEADAENEEIVQVACNGGSGKMCALICFQPNDNNPFVLTKKVNLKQIEDGKAWANGPKANGRVANAKAD